MARRVLAQVAAAVAQVVRLLACIRKLIVGGLGRAQVEAKAALEGDNIRAALKLAVGQRGIRSSMR